MFQPPWFLWVQLLTKPVWVLLLQPVITRLSYNGYKLKANYGGPLTPEKVQEVEDIIPAKSGTDLDKISLKDAETKGLLEYKNLEDLYVQQVEKNFDIAAIKNSGIRFAYDSMYGAGKRVMTRLFPEIVHLHNDDNPGFSRTSTGTYS